MMPHKRGPMLSSLAGNLSAFVLVTLALNGLIFALGWDRQSTATIRGIPPGWVVGLIWVLLFAGMGAARALLLRREACPRWIAELPALLAFLCLIYPLYTSGLSDDRTGLVGNVLTAAVALPAAALAWRHSRPAGGYLAAVCLWLLYAAAATALSLSH